MMAFPHDPRHQQTAQAQAAHERAKKDRQRNGGGADDDLEELQPDDFVDQRRAAARRKERDERPYRFGTADHRGIRTTGAPARRR
jgi:hypothetical protein